MKNCDNTIIYKNHIGGETCRYILIDVTESAMIPLNSLKWHKGSDDECDGYLTLKEIGEQLTAKGSKGVFYVWTETPLSGVIYQYGNYSDVPHWIEHGKTQGYA